MPIYRIRGEEFIQEVDSPYVTVRAAKCDIALIEWTAAQATLGTTTAVHGAITLTSAAQTITDSITNPSCARNLTVTVALGGGTSLSGNVVITGTNIFGKAITESIAVSTAQTYILNSAFKTVTSITVPAKANASGDTISIGTGAKLGLPFLCNKADQIIQASLNYAIEGTRATLADNPTNIEGNTVTLNSTLNGSVVRVFLMVY